MLFFLLIFVLEFLYFKLTFLDLLGLINLLFYITFFLFWHMKDLLLILLLYFVKFILNSIDLQIVFKLLILKIFLGLLILLFQEICQSFYLRLQCLRLLLIIFNLSLVLLHYLMYLLIQPIYFLLISLIIHNLLFIAFNLLQNFS